MTKKAKLTGPEQVQQFLAQTDHPLKDEIVALRQIILDSGRPITEQIKWNAPSFGYDGEDRLTFKLNSPAVVDIVLHRGVKVKALPQAPLIEDPHNLIKWATTDRGIVSFASTADIENKKSAFLDIINNWLTASTTKT